MESPPSPERVAAAGSGDIGDRVCDGVEVDVQWRHQSVCEQALGREPV